MKILLPARMLCRVAWMAAAIALAPLIHAQSVNTIHIRLLDGRTGLPVKASNFLVRVDHHETVHNEWVQIGDDGSVTVSVPDDAKEISVKATYDMSMETYVNCDAAKENDKEREIWYPISVIMKTGAVAPNECSKTDYTAKPGEFVFFVRKRGWRDLPND
jgi:hypothetical protein